MSKIQFIIIGISLVLLGFEILFGIQKIHRELIFVFPSIVVVLFIAGYFFKPKKQQ